MDASVLSAVSKTCSEKVVLDTSSMRVASRREDGSK
jgi:hypothetical protein